MQSSSGESDSAYALLGKSAVKPTLGSKPAYLLFYCPRGDYQDRETPTSVSAFAFVSYLLFNPLLVAEKLFCVSPEAARERVPKTDKANFGKLRPARPIGKDSQFYGF